MFQRLLSTNIENAFPTVIRITLGLVMFPHGAQKLLGWFGGYGFEGTMGYFTGTVGIPWVIGALVIIIEFFGSLMLILGIGTRFLAGIFMVLVTGIIFATALPNGFFMNWFGNQKGEGYEYFLLMLGMAGALLISGGGRWSFDGLRRSR